MYLNDLVAECLAKRGLPGTVSIRRRGAQFTLEFQGTDGTTAAFPVDQYELTSGTVGAPIAESLAKLVLDAARAPKLAA